MATNKTDCFDEGRIVYDSKGRAVAQYIMRKGRQAGRMLNPNYKRLVAGQEKVQQSLSSVSLKSICAVCVCVCVLLSIAAAVYSLFVL